MAPARTHDDLGGAPPASGHGGTATAAAGPPDGAGRAVLPGHRAAAARARSVYAPPAQAPRGPSTARLAMTRRARRGEADSVRNDPIL